jgi:2-oxoglutarate ferredoxin oxidoreductase subunit delta
MLHSKGGAVNMARIIIDETICKGCEMCVNACPRKIIALAKDKINSKGYHPAQLLDESKCTGCCSCALMCPDVAITVER